MRTPYTLCALAALLLIPTSADAQTVIYQDDFDGRRVAWQANGLWAADESPASVAGGAAYSGTKSLNFNNGTDYAGNARGATSSPVIDAAGNSAHTIQFRCNYETETTGLRYDQRAVVIRVNSNVVLRQQLASSRSQPAGARCGSMGVWHQHSIDLPAANSRSRVRIQVELEFNSIDAVQNNHAGWFVDDFTVLEVGAPPPPAQVFDSVSRTTNDFRDNSVTLRVQADRSVELARSSPTARYALLTGTATAAEFAALTQAIQNGAIGTIPANIPDPNTYIVRPTSSRLEVRSQVSSNDNTIGSSLGVYGQWARQLTPVMAAIQAIQDRILAGANQPADDHGNDANSATQFAVGDPAANGNIEVAGDVDWFKVVDTNPMIMIFPPPQRTYTFETTVQGNMDTVIELYANDGTTLIASNDDGGNGLASRIVHTAFAGSTFYVKVRHYSSSNGTGLYTFRAGGPLSPTPPPNPVTDDHSNGMQNATLLPVDGSTLAGTIEVGGDQDWFQLQQFVIAIFPPPTFTYVVETAVQGNMDTVIELLAADGTTVLESNDDAPGLGLGSRITYTAQAGSAVYVKVRHYSGSGTGSYTVKVTATTQTP